MTSQTPPSMSGEAIPLPETGSSPRNTYYIPDPQVEALTPTQPEVLPLPSTPTQSQSAYLPPLPSTNPIGNGGIDVLPSSPSVLVNPVGQGGMLISQGQVIDQASLQLQGVGDPFGTTSQIRTPSSDLFKSDTDVDGALLAKYVTDPKMHRLWNELESLQEVVLQHVSADRSVTDAYQQDLLHASDMLLKSAANYDDAREIVFRIKADLRREQKVLDDIRRYRPRLLAYYTAWVLIAFVAILEIIFNPAFAQLAPTELPIMKLAFMPMVFGILGAVLNGFMAINTHTTVKRDFDPIHISWYIINPMIGGVMGLVVFIFFVVTGASLSPGLATAPVTTSGQQPPFIIWVLAFAVGWQQNVMFALLNRFLKTFLPDKDAGTDTTTSSRPPVPSTSAGSTDPSLDAKG